MERILVTGVSGQIGSYLAEMLLAEGHEVLGLGRREEALPRGVTPATGSLEPEGIEAVVRGNGALTAIVHLAGRSSVAKSWETPLETFDVNARATAALVFTAAKAGGVRFVNASSAEIFGAAKTPVQNEETPIAPNSPYAVAKAAAHGAVQVARAGYAMAASNLIFYLGESERRAPHFVVRKITRTVAAIAKGRADHLSLGNTSVIRDFSYAKDLAKAAKMLALGAPAGDYVCASGEGHTIGDVADLACRMAGLDPAKVLRTDPSLFRPTDIPSLVGDSAKLRAIGWAPTLGFEALVRQILEYDLAHDAE